MVLMWLDITSRVRGVIGDQSVVCAYAGRYKILFKGPTIFLNIFLFSFTLSVSII